jgi:hypothetical protein
MTAAGSDDKNKQSWWYTDAFLGVLVVLLTVATAFSAYRGSLAGIEGDDLDFAGQKKMVLASSSFLSGNSELQEDRYNYDAYRELLGVNADEAAIYLNRFSVALRASLERPGGPFDELYEEALYEDALDLFAEVESLEEQANLADEKASAYELSGLIFAIGLAAVAWAALVGTGRRIRLIFLLVALVAFVAGATVIIRIVL